MSWGVIVLGGNCPGGNCPRRVIVRGVIVLGGHCPGGNCPGGSCPGGNCPDTVPHIRTTPHHTGFGPDKWFYSVVVVLAGCCPGAK